MELQIILFSLLLQFHSLLDCGVALSVNSDTGNDSMCSPCKTLEALYRKIQGESNVDIFVESDIFLYFFEVQFENVSNIHISGNSADNQSTIRCKGKAGFYVNNVTDFTVTNLTIQGCKITRGNFTAAVIFKNSMDITLTSVVIQRSPSGITFLACFSNVFLANVTFQNNGQNDNSCDSFPTGVTMEISEPVNYKLYNVSFLSNQCFHAKRRGRSELIGGGALGIFFRSHASDGSVQLKSCKFFNNRANAFGGGLSVFFKEVTNGNNVSVNNSRFVNNSASIGGGGVYILFENYRTLRKRTNRIAFHDVDFHHNSASLYGGGTSISASYSYFQYGKSKKPSILFHNCTWLSNTAKLSSAVDITPVKSWYILTKGGFLPTIVFENVTVMYNYNYFNIGNSNGYDKPKTLLHLNASGVFTVTQFSVYFKILVNFTHNRYSALYLASAFVIFERNTQIYFQHNHGSTGAAIAMYSKSFLFIFKNTHFWFMNNKATHKGGAISFQTSDQHDYIRTSSCFIRYADYHNISFEERNISFFFSNNSAALNQGNAIYADTFKSCKSVCNMSDFMKCIGNVTFMDSERNQSDFGHSYYYGSSSYNFTFQDEVTEYEMIPGNGYNIPFTVLDEFQHGVHPLLSLNSENANIRVYPTFSVSGDITPYGKPGDTADVSFMTQNSRKILFKFKIKTLNCPPGFYFGDDSCYCSVIRMYKPITNCNHTSFRAYMEVDYWSGYIPSESNNYTDLYFAPCFTPVCVSYQYKSVYLPANSSRLNEIICGENRHGLMCGRCTANTSTYYHSNNFKCGHNHLCHYGPLFYLVSEILPMAILFALIVIFDVNFSSGNIVGFIFFAQYLDKPSTDINATLRYLQRGYQILYGIFDFEYFSLEHLSFCLWKNFQILDIITFRYTTIVMAFGLVMILITLLRSNKCTKLWKWRTKLSYKTSFVHGLSAFLIICYNQCTQISFLILKVVTPKGFQGKQIQTYSYYGGLPFFHSHHLIYAIPALFSLVVVTILPPLVLLLYPLSLQLLSLCHISEHWIVNKILKIFFINKLVPFIDNFQSCYKDRFRFFAGLYFVYRVAILCCFTLSQSRLTYRISTGLLLLTILGIHSALQPYKKCMHNLIDSLIFFNLTLINTLALVNDYIIESYLKPHRTYSDSKHLITVASIQLMLTYLPMLVFINWAIVHLFCFLKTIRRGGHVEYELLVDSDRGE